MASIQRTDYGVAYKKALRDAHDLIENHSMSLSRRKVMSKVACKAALKILECMIKDADVMMLYGSDTEIWLNHDGTLHLREP